METDVYADAVPRSRHDAVAPRAAVLVGHERHATSAGARKELWSYEASLPPAALFGFFRARLPTADAVQGSHAGDDVSTPTWALTTRAKRLQVVIQLVRRTGAVTCFEITEHG